LFKDRNFVIGLLFIFVIGIILLATMALLPPFLQNLKHYPVVTTGYVMAPRGIGTMISMLLVGRLVGKFDVRLLIFIGLSLAIVSLWQMSNFGFDTDVEALTISGVIQGFGLGFIFVPLSAITFATLEASLRTEATALFSLMRNLGSAIGISVVNWLLARNTQINHAELSQHITLLNPMLQAPYAPDSWSPGQASGLIALDQVVNAQASMISYLNDFLFMMWITIAAIPMLLLLRKPRRKRDQAEEEMETAAAID
jgi:DHA2 family multidrug resistance protein